jgi:transcriptional regulator of aromatic amino acid metabolism
MVVELLDVLVQVEVHQGANHVSHSRLGKQPRELPKTHQDSVVGLLDLHEILRRDCRRLWLEDVQQTQVPFASQVVPQQVRTDRNPQANLDRQVVVVHVDQSLQAQVTTIVCHRTPQSPSQNDEQNKNANKSVKESKKRDTERRKV